VSASNWATCPRCVKSARKEVEQRAETLRTGYGSLSQDEYMAIVYAPAPEILTDRAPHTFREDYEIYGAESGTVTVTYGGSCGTCGLSLTFKHEHPVPGATDG
jgi:hypothetical protein